MLDPLEIDRLATLADIRAVSHGTVGAESIITLVEREMMEILDASKKRDK
jgi:hypothetical protein